jgi:serine/threonine protein kinase
VILYEIRTGKRAFGRDLKPLSVMVEIVWKNSRPDIPDEVLPEAARLIRDCWRKKPRKRHSFAEILMHLDAMDFKIAPGVRSGKVRAFVNAVKTKELCLGLEIDSPK